MLNNDFVLLVDICTQFTETFISEIAIQTLAIIYDYMNHSPCPQLFRSKESSKKQLDPLYQVFGIKIQDEPFIVV